MKNVVILTGAGISSESGLKTFRDNNGLWEGHRVEEVATPEAFARDPETVHRFYNMRRQQLYEVEPNKAHDSLAEFEKKHKGSFTLITQNVDDLHRRSGSKNVIHMHGELLKVRSLDTGQILDWEKDLTKESRYRPHICWFGEVPFQMDEIQEAVEKADLFVAIGTSGVVYPAAGLVQLAPRGCRTVLLNKEAPDNNHMFKEVCLGPATEIVPRFFTTLL